MAASFMRENICIHSVSSNSSYDKHKAGDRSLETSVKPIELTSSVDRKVATYVFVRTVGKKVRYTDDYMDLTCLFTLYSSNTKFNFQQIQ